ncbi:hypothetical protein PAXRUDRAFT_831821, partial [Paxillus rubicundulus Ve08.2h10]
MPKRSRRAQVGIENSSMSRTHSCLQACSGTTASREAINTSSHSRLSPSTPVPSSPVLSQLDNSPSKRCVQWPPVHPPTTRWTLTSRN